MNSPAHATELQQLLDCPRKWRFIHDLGKDTLKSTALTFGSVFHKVLECWAKRESVEKYLDTVSLTPKEMTVIKNLLPYWEQYYWENLENYHIVDTEKDFDLHIPGSYSTMHIAGTMDIVMVDKHDNLWVADYKTAISFPKDPALLVMDVQFHFYYTALKYLYPEANVAGTIPIFFRKVNLQHPKVKFPFIMHYPTTWGVEANLTALRRMENTIARREELLRTTAECMPRTSKRISCDYCSLAPECLAEFCGVEPYTQEREDDDEWE